MRTKQEVVSLLCCLALSALSGCGGEDDADEPAAARPATPAASAAAGLRLVSLGDSSATGEGDEEGRGGWVQRYADLVSDTSGREVEVLARARGGLSSDVLVKQVREDAGLREEIAAADVIVIGAGGADLNAGDEALEAGACTGAACYEPVLEAYGTNIATVVSVISELRAGKPTVLRAVTPPNGLTGAEAVIPPFLRPVATEVGVAQARSQRASTCAAVRSHSGDCIDVLTAFNGADGTADAYASGLMNLESCCYASARGQQKMAELLLALGLEPQELA